MKDLYNLFVALNYPSIQHTSEYAVSLEAMVNLHLLYNVHVRSCIRVLSYLYKLCTC